MNKEIRLDRTIDREKFKFIPNYKISGKLYTSVEAISEAFDIPIRKIRTCITRKKMPDGTMIILFDGKVPRGVQKWKIH